LLPTLLLTLASPRTVAKGWWAFYVPIVGPFMALDLLDAEDTGAAILVGCGLLQAGGVVAVVIGAGTAEGPRLLRVNTTSRVTLSPGAAGAPGLSVRVSF
jgi:hypothetical protein